MTKKTRNEQLLEHFQNGGGPLTSDLIAELLGVSLSTGSRVMDNAQASVTYQATITRRPGQYGGIRVLEGIKRLERKPKMRLTDDLKNTVQSYIRRHPTQTPITISKAVGCSSKLARTLRNELIDDGTIPNETIIERKERDPDLIMPTGRPAEDEPHLAKAARFREIWPARKGL